MGFPKIEIGLFQYIVWECLFSLQWANKHRANKWKGTATKRPPLNQSVWVVEWLALPILDHKFLCLNPAEAEFSYYENMPIQIYRKFHHQKLKIIR